MNTPDEKAIERDYCDGVLSLQAITEKYGITVKALRYMADKKGWKRIKGAKKGQKNGAKKIFAPESDTAKNNHERSPFSEQHFLSKNSVSAKTENGFDPEEFGISEQQAIFAEYHAAGKSLVESYRLAGYQAEGNATYAAASRLLRNVKVSRAVRYLRERRQKRLSFAEDEIIHQLVSIASADPNALVQYRRVNCRHCWGEKFLYQWRDIDEYDRAAEKAYRSDKAEPEYGGIGFVANAIPNPDCPRCCGEGEGEVFIADTDTLEGRERYLYAGVKQTKFGLELQLANQEAARRDLLRYLALREGGKTSLPPVPEEDYQLHSLNPDEPPPGKPVL
ncbi:terminase small subunit [Pantoea osteomyelitidis]|uniref:Terminase small subunit n=1 Tax=Pantoea osteomyelitidis TaxID=3230026 RepID=A0ABW7PWR0_9GAMM